MDKTKWKSVLVPLDMYKELVALSKLEGRTISGQLRYSYEAFKQANLSTKDQSFLAQEVRKREAANSIQ
jgi:hypothetical protein|tara:strand:+ start:3510 stop:3716 length:207 start_codon:yes stop_codon:yes gene_type:complete